MTGVISQSHRWVAIPRWLDRLFLGLIVYVVIAATWMLAGFGGPWIMRFVGLLADSPACFMATIIALSAARHAPSGPIRKAWYCLGASLAFYFVGTVIGVNSWLHGRDPFPGIPDIFYVAFYPAFFAGVLFLIRAGAVRIPWGRLGLDAAILVIGFGAFFWYLVIRSAAPDAQNDVLKYALSQAYLALNCTVVLELGILLLTCVGRDAGRRIPLLLIAGFSTMFLADILWSVAKVTGAYLPGNFQDVLYVSFYVPLAAAAREQMRPRPLASARQEPRMSDTLLQSLPYAAMLTAFLVLVNFTHGDISSPATVMTMVVFALTLLLMLRQSLVLREEALTRERRAARLVEDRYASLIANAADVIMIVSAEGEIKFASPACERTLGLRPAEVAGKHLFDHWSGEDAQRLRLFLADVAATHGVPHGPVELSIEHGANRHVLEIIGSNMIDDPAVQGLALNFRDISERKALEDQLRELAFHDPLTLLANRNLFRDRVQHALELSQRGQHRVAVMFLDLDNFKNVNDSLGHDAGDTLLQTVARRLVATTRKSDTVARLGGDEFAILVEGFAAVEEVTTVAESVTRALDKPLTLGATELHVRASVGVAFGEPNLDAEALLSRADIAMYHAKAAGKNRYVPFEPRMQEMLHQRLRLEADLARAIHGSEFFLEYQPVIDLGTRSLLGVEALVRWRHPELGVLLPNEFIQIAEECGQIIGLGRWVLHRSCAEMRAWRGSVSGGHELRLAVNISGRHLQHGDLVEDVARALQDSGLEPGNLIIELTESTVIHNTEQNLERLRRLKGLGVRLAIDDFGMGYSSLSYLHRLPIDILKVDRSFVARLSDGNRGPELARTVIALGDTLGLDTVAEGIELEPQVAALLELGCVAGQGFLFAAPASLAHLSTSIFVARRKTLWSEKAALQDLSATGRFAALKASG
jgi:diguanylate cyclase (GGDEF)-like protein/PAS domain S-box-containing protein